MTDTAGDQGSDAVDSVAFPTLSEQDLERIAAYGTEREVAAGTILFAAGDPGYDFFVIVDAVVAIVHRDGADEDVIATHGAGRFVGELNLLSGARPQLTARVERPGRIIQVPAADLRRLLDREGNLSRLIVDAFLARRALMQSGGGARTLQILGSRYSPETLQLRQFVTRMRLPHVWEDLEDWADIDAVLAEIGVRPSDTPVVVTPTGVLRRPTPGELAEVLGLTFHSVEGELYDVVIVGAGPAGLAAAVYGASEGLQTLALDGAGPGGQAGTSSLIENYLGFPSGISGRDLTDRAAAQAQKFGARITCPCQAGSLQVGSPFHVVQLLDGTEIPTRVVVIASGARYRRLPLDGWALFEGAGIYYAATDVETRSCDGRPVVVLGGGNSAGQAALFLADHASSVQLVVRRDGLEETMSRYLIDRIQGSPRITLRSRTLVTALHGDGVLRQIDLTDPSGASTVDCAGLFCFIGAVAATDWLPTEVRLDEHGFVLTDRDLAQAGASLSPPGREPFPFESSVPGVFAVGDVRHGSTKRVAAAVGEGASAIRSAHQYLAALD